MFREKKKQVKLSGERRRAKRRRLEGRKKKLGKTDRWFSRDEKARERNIGHPGTACSERMSETTPTDLPLAREAA